MPLLLLLSASIGAGVTIYGKTKIDKGLSPKKFIFIQTFSMVLINGILFLFYPFEFAFSVTAVSLILGNALLRILGVTLGADNLRHISALEHAAYTSFAIFVTYIIDVLLGSNVLTVLGAGSIVLVVAGSVLMAKGLSFKKVGWKLIVRIVCNVSRGYIAYYALNFAGVGNVTFIFLTFVASALLLLPFYKYFNSEKITKADWKFSFTSQSLSLIAFISSNVLAKDSATLYMLVRPMNMVLLFFASLLMKKQSKNQLSKMQFVGALVIILGIALFTINKF